MSELIGRAEQHVGRGMGRSGRRREQRNRIEGMGGAVVFTRPTIERDRLGQGRSCLREIGLGYESIGPVQVESSLPFETMGQANGPIDRSHDGFRFPGEGFSP